MTNDAQPWHTSYRASRLALPLADRHYNRQKPGSPQFVPPGSCFVLLTKDRKALWVSSRPKAEYVHHAWAGAWVNSTFRNESESLSSDLIRAAVAATLAEWGEPPALGFVTFIDPAKTTPKEVPGWCYRQAGWRRARCPKHPGRSRSERLDSDCAACHGRTKERGFIALELTRSRMERPGSRNAAIGSQIGLPF